MKAKKKTCSAIATECGTLHVYVDEYEDVVDGSDAQTIVVRCSGDLMLLLSADEARSLAKALLMQAGACGPESGSAVGKSLQTDEPSRASVT